LCVEGRVVLGDFEGAGCGMRAQEARQTVCASVKFLEGVSVALDSRVWTYWRYPDGTR
jgi:hypothetical protein